MVATSYRIKLMLCKMMVSNEFYCLFDDRERAGGTVQFMKNNIMRFVKKSVFIHHETCGVLWIVDELL